LDLHPHEKLFIKKLGEVRASSLVISENIACRKIALREIDTS